MMETNDERVINLTRNDVVIIGNYHQVVAKIPRAPRGKEATIRFDREIVRLCRGAIPIIRIPPEGVTIQGLPDPEPGVLYITSSVIAAHAQRPDVVSPDTAPGGAVKLGGNLVGVKGLQCWM